MTEGDQSVHSLAIEEYKFLRREILLRILLQNLVLMLLIPAFLAALITSVGFPHRGSEAALGYVGVAGMGALYWIHSAARTVQIKAFLRQAEAAEDTSISWETWLAHNPLHGPLGSRWFISTKAVFVVSQLTSIALLGIFIGGAGRDLLVLGGAALATAITAMILIQPRMRP
jgi:hypothetical protein